HFALYMILFGQLGLGQLFSASNHGTFRCARRVLINHIGYLVLRTHVLLWAEVTLQTPGHVQTLRLVHQTHLVYTAMTLSTTNPLVNMGTMVKINEVGKLMNTHPFNRLISAPTLTHRLQD